MAVAFVRSHTVTSEKVSDVSVDLAISTATTPGNVLVAYILFDNAGTTLKPVVSSIARAAGETNAWVSLGAARSASTSAGAFASGEMWAIRTSVVWPVASYAVTLDTAVTMKATLAQEFSGALATARSTGGTGYSTTTAVASATTTGTTPVTGDLAVGFMFQSNSVSIPTFDADTLGGAWANNVAVGSTGGSAATNNYAQATSKVLTAGSHQTLNSSAATLTAGNGSIVAILQQYVDPSLTQAAYRFYAEPTLVDGFDETNGTSWNAHYGASPNNKKGQSFLGDGGGITSAGFYLKKTGTPTGTLIAHLYAHTGTYGAADGTPTGSPIQTSSTVLDPVSVSTTGAWYDFDFDGSTVLGDGVPYFLVLEAVGNTANSSNCTSFFTHNAPSTHPGRWTTYFNTAWSSTSDYDACFRVYSDTALAAQDTTPAVDTSAGDVNAQLRVRLQSTTSAAVDPWDGNFGLQWEKNASGTWANLGVAGTGPESLVDEYSDANYSASVGIQSANIPTYVQSVVGQGGPLSRAEFFMSRAGTPNGNVAAVLYADGGADLPTGAPLATSTPIDSLSLPTGNAFVSFAFDSTYVLQPGTSYFIGMTTTSTANTTNVGLDHLSPTHAGKCASYSISLARWNAQATYDLVFRVFTADPVPPPAYPYDSPNLTDNAATTSRLTGGSGTFTAGKVSEDGLADDVGFGGNNHTEILYSLTFKAADLTAGDTLRFRVLRNGSITGFTYTQVPTVTIGGGGPQAKPLAGTVAATSATSGTPAAVHPLTGTTAATTSTAGTIGQVGGAQSYPLAGTVAGTSATSGAIAAVHPLAGTTAATSATVGALRSNLPLTGTTAATTSTAGTIGVVVGAQAHPLEGTVAATSTTTGVLSRLNLALAATAAAISLTTGAPTAVHPLGGTTPATSTTSGAIGAKATLAGTVTATSATSGTISAVHPLDGVTTATTTTTGNPAAVHPLAGAAVTAVSTTSGTINLVGGPQTYPLSGTVAGTSTTTGTLRARLTLTGTVAATSTTTGTLTTVGGRPKVWTGTAWAAKPAKVWSGSAWVEKPVRAWSGTGWKALI